MLIWIVILLEIAIGTDDDLPPPHQNRFSRNAHVGNGRSAVARSVPYSRLHNDMETQIHLIEQEAYCSILRAFKAQSDAITWVLPVIHFLCYESQYIQLV